MITPQQFIKGILYLQPISINLQNPVQDQSLVIYDQAVPTKEGLDDQVDWGMETSHGYILSVMLF